MRKILLALALILSLTAGAEAQPDPSANPVLAQLQRAGAKFFYLGNQNGMDGWFIFKDGQVQVTYATPDDRATLIGVMFGSSGENITANQVAKLVETNKDFAAAMAETQKQMGNAGAAAAEAAIVSPGEKLLGELRLAATVEIGNPSTPEIVMVMDPQCPHCQKTWTMLRDKIGQGKFHVRLVPTGAPGTENERTAAVLLSSPDGGTRWDKYIAGDKTQLAGTPATETLLAVHLNDGLVDKWKISQTPYLVYRDKSGTVKIIAGEPKAAALFGDMGIE